MSRTARAVLTASTVFTCSVIYYVHLSQKRDKMRLQEGIIFDLERQQQKIQNLRQLELQADLTKILRQHQKETDEKEKLTTSSDSTS